MRELTQAQIEEWITTWIDNIYSELDKKIDESNFFVTGTGKEKES